MEEVRNGDPKAGFDDLHNVAQQPTDIGNAARFVLRNRERALCSQSGWYVYDGARFRPDDTHQIVKLGMDNALQITHEAERLPWGEERVAMLKHATRSQNMARVMASLELAKPWLSVAPAKLDADPWLLNLRNGTFDLRTGKLRKHDPADHITKLCNASYIPEAEAPVFLRTVSQLFPNDGLAAYVVRCAGYSLTGSIREQCLFFASGNGDNGKSTFLNAIAYVMGDYAGRAERELLLHRDGAAHPAGIAAIQGLRNVILSETEEGARFDEGKLKDLVAEPILKARRMYGDFFEFPNQSKLWIAGNHKPILRGTDKGLWRRWRLIPFEAVIPDREKDLDLPQKLEAEADGIMGVLLTGCREWLANGLQTPREVMDATNAYRAEMDSFGSFITDRCEVGSLYQATAMELYGAYRAWAEANGEKPASQKRLAKYLHEKGFTNDARTGTGRKLWCGLQLAQLSHLNEPNLIP